MPAIVTGNADGAHVLLDGRAHNVADRAMVTEINDFNPVPNELQVDRIDRAVVSITNWHSGQDSYWRGHQAKSLMVIV